MSRLIAFVFLFCLTLSACDFFSKDKGEGVLARVYDKYLYEKDIEDLLVKLTGDKDSATIINNYVNNWVQQELLLAKAELNLSEEQKDFQKLLEDYRRSLIIFAYQKEWVRQNLDTNVTEEEILRHYEANESNFELKENILKMRFAHVPRNAPKLSLVETLIQKNDSTSRAEFREYCVQYAKDYIENDTVWMPFDNVKLKMPLQVEDEEGFLAGNKFVQKEDSLNIYLLYISDYKIKNAISPLSFEREKIRNIIVNQRKLELINSMKGDLFEVALDKGNAEIYTH